MPDTILRPPLTGRLNAGTKRPSPEAEEAVAPGKAYATVAGVRPAIALEFIRRGGQSFSVPYGYAPLLWWNPPGTLILEYPGLFSVVLRGKNLGEIQRRIRDGRVTWVRECDDAEAAALPAAITGIEIVLAYPSQDAGTEFSTPPPPA